MPSIAIIIPVCSRGQSYKKIEDIPLLKVFINSISDTLEANFQYEIFLGYDNDDVFYKENINQLSNITKNIYELKGCQHAPAWAWNELATIAYELKFDYIFQIGDDVRLASNNWTSKFIEILARNRNIGVVGPSNLRNLTARKLSGKSPVIENAFVHRTHLDIFKTFFHPSIKNWYCDDWLTRVYQRHLSIIHEDIICENSIVKGRYEVEHVGLLDDYVKKGEEAIEYHLLREFDAR